LCAHAAPPYGKGVTNDKSPRPPGFWERRGGGPKFKTKKSESPSEGKNAPTRAPTNNGGRGGRDFTTRRGKKKGVGAE